MCLLRLTKVSHSFEVHHQNGVHIGTLEVADDGFWVFWPNHHGRKGYWTQELCRSIVEELEKLNAPLHKQIEEDLLYGGET